MRSGFRGDTVGRMPRRPPLTDLGLAAAGMSLTLWVVWVHPSVGNPVAGPTWLLAGWPLLLDVPLAWRRTAPLAVCLLVLIGIDLQSAWTSNSAEGLEVIFALGVAIYSVAAYGGRRQALTGLAGFGVGYAIFTWFDRNVQTGQSSEEWSAAFFCVIFVTMWFAGVWIRSRRETAVLAERTAGLEREAAAAVAGERARMARELHDIVSHNLSVVVLQAAGARAGGASASTLEKIERSGREALVEMRRLLGVLRDGTDDNELLAPQPGIAELEQLAESVRAAGVPVELELDGELRPLPPAVELAAYRIVQEALTNVLKHAAPARATVRVCLDGEALSVEVRDDGADHGTAATNGGGHGLPGMRERVALFGGSLESGTLPGGGFLVRARLPTGAA
jgi:signal transduction histidine kinase